MEQVEKKKHFLERPVPETILHALYGCFYPDCIVLQHINSGGIYQYGKKHHLSENTG